MATIGTFTKTGDNFTGTVTARRPNDRTPGDFQPGPVRTMTAPTALK